MQISRKKTTEIETNPYRRLAGEIWDKIEDDEKIAVFRELGYTKENEIWMLDPMTMYWDGITQKRVWYPKLTPVILKLYGGKNEKC